MPFWLWAYRLGVSMISLVVKDLLFGNQRKWIHGKMKLDGKKKPLRGMHVPKAWDVVL